MLQNPTDSTELDSSSSFDPLALPPSTENEPTTFTHTHTTIKHTSAADREHFSLTENATTTNLLLYLLLRRSDTHLPCGGVDELGTTVHWTRQHQRAILVARQAGQRPLVSVLTCWTRRTMNATAMWIFSLMLLIDFKIKANDCEISSCCYDCNLMSLVDCCPDSK